MGDRALYAVWNTGAGTTSVTARGLHAAWNVGVFTATAGRGLHAVWNVGVYSILLARALYAYLAVALRGLPDDPIEIQLIENNLIDILRVLRGK